MKGFCQDNGRGTASTKPKTLVKAQLLRFMVLNNY